MVDLGIKKYKFCGRQATRDEIKHDGRQNYWIAIYDKDSLSVTREGRPRIGTMKETNFFVARGDYCGLYEYKTVLVCPECSQKLGIVW